MTSPAAGRTAGKLQTLLRAEVRSLLTIQPSDRPWQMPLAAGLSSALPVFVGAYFGRLDYGLVASLGGLIFLHLPRTPLHHRMVSIMACAFVLTNCYALGLMSHSIPALMTAALVFITILVTMLGRFYAVGPPGSLFFIMAAAIGAYTPARPADVPLLIGLVSLGTLGACLIAFFYSVHTLPRHPARPADALPRPTFDFVVFDSVVIGVFVGIALALAQLLRLERAYWVPVACLAVIQGTTLRAVWNRQVQRVLGTGIGLLLAWGLLLLPLDNWSVAVLVLGLTFVIEMAVVRHYAFAAIFITPLSILLAEAATRGQPASASALIQARFLDTVLGCLVGFIGGVCLHHQRLRTAVSRPMRRLLAFSFLR